MASPLKWIKLLCAFTRFDISTERDHVLNAWNLELIKVLDDEYFAMCKFLLERCHARKDRTLRYFELI